MAGSVVAVGTHQGRHSAEPPASASFFQPDQLLTPVAQPQLRPDLSSVNRGTRELEREVIVRRSWDPNVPLIMNKWLI